MKNKWMYKITLVVFLLSFLTPSPVRAEANEPLSESGNFKPLTTVVVNQKAGEMAQVNGVPDSPIVSGGGKAIQDAPLIFSEGIYDDTATPIVWTGTWSQEVNNNALGGSYHESTVVGSTLSFEFSGTEVSLIYAVSSAGGEAEIYIDDTLYDTINMYNSTASWQSKWTSAILDDSGPHTLRMEHSSGTAVNLDGLEVANPAPDLVFSEGYYENTDSKVEFSGNWVYWSSTNYSGGSMNYSNTYGNSLSLQFTGTQFTLIYSAAANRGVGEVVIDGQVVGTVNQYSSATVYKKRWQTPILDDSGPHTLTLRHLSGGGLDFDAFEIADIQLQDPIGSGMVEDNDPPVVYYGSWVGRSAPAATSGSIHDSGRIGNSANMKFLGKRASVYYSTCLNCGIAEVRIDNILVATLNQNSATTQYGKVWQSNLLNDLGPHTLSVTHVSGNQVNVDAFEVFTPQPVGAGTYDDTSNHIIYSGNWTAVANNSGPFDGTLHFTNQAGASASLEFSAPRVSVIYTKYITRGNLEIIIDDQAPVVVNAYSTELQWQSRWDSPLLSEGTHTIKIRNSGDGKYVDVDAIIVVDPEENPPAAITNLAATPGAQDGTINLGWTATGDDGLDGISSSYVVRYSQNPIDSDSSWNASVDVVGEPVPAASGTSQSMTVIGLVPQQTYYFAIRAIDDCDNMSELSNSADAKPSGKAPVGVGVYDNFDGNLVFSGTWGNNPNTAGPYNSTLHYSNTPGSTVSLAFMGTEVSLIYTKYSNRGNVEISIDGGAPIILNAKASSLAWQQRWDSGTLTSGAHTISLRHPGGSHYIDVDAFIVSNASTPTPTIEPSLTASLTLTPSATPEFDPPDGKEVYRSSYAPSTAGDNPESDAANSDSYGDSITGNGQYTVFSSMADNLVYGTNPCGATYFNNVYMHDRQTGTNTCLSTVFGAAVDAESVDPFISDTGQFVVFASRATSFTSGSAPDGIQQIYLLNRTGNQIIPVSRNDNAEYADADSYDPYVTPDGQYVIFTSVATNLVAGDTNGVKDVFIHDMGDRGPNGSYSGSGANTIRISVTNDGSELSAGSYGSKGSFLSDDGLFAAFTSDSPDLTGDGTGSTEQVFYRDLDAGTTSLVSKNGSSNPGNDDSWVYNLTAEGRYVMFYSTASDLVAGGNTTEDAYVADMQTGTIILMSLPAAQTIDPFPAVEGGKIVFETTKPLVAEDTNGVKDVYLRKSDGTTLLVSLPMGASNTDDYASTAPAISTDGRFVVFTSMVNALDPVDNPPSGGEPNIDNLYIRQVDGRWEGPVEGTYDDTDSNVNYTGSWAQGSNANTYNGSYHYSTTVGNEASFTFKGRRISLIFSKSSTMGVMEIEIDGQFVQDLDQNSLLDIDKWQQRWESPDLITQGPHTITVRHKTGSMVVVDGFTISDAITLTPGVYDDDSEGIQYTGNWETYSEVAGPYGGTLHYTNEPGGSASFTFFGMKLVLIYTTFQTRGIASISIDGGEPISLDQYGQNTQWQSRWESDWLDEGIHTVQIVNPGGGHYIDIDAVIVIYPSLEMDPPSAITDLEANPGIEAGVVNLIWTATGDDFQSGTASEYVVRYSQAKINSEQAWAAATDVLGEPMPSEAGTQETMDVTNLIPGITYYFAVRAVDDGSNQSELSNSPNAAAPGEPPAAPGTYDDFSNKIEYTGTWGSNAAASGPFESSMHYTTQQGSSARFNFAGTGVSLIYTKHTNRGNISISIDGGSPVIINAYSPSTVWQARWDSWELTPSEHTIEISHPGGGYYIDIDAIVVTWPESIPPDAIDDLIAVQGENFGEIDLSWTATGDDGAVGTAQQYMIRYSREDFNSEEAWNEAISVENSLSPSAAGGEETFTVTGLLPGQTYYFAIKAIDDSGNLSAMSNSPYAVATTPEPVTPGTYDDASEKIIFSDNWSYNPNTSGPYAKTLHYTNQNGATASLTFSAPKISLVYTKYTNRGNLEVSIDGEPPVVINGQSASLAWQQQWDSPLLSPGTHTIVVTHPGGSHYIDVDAFIVVDPETDPPATVSDLSANQGSGANGEVDLTWTAPGDDGNTGTATTYIVRYSESAINNEDDWNAATDVVGEPLPSEAGTGESMTVGNLFPARTYYFAIKTLDDAGNQSGLSNGTSALANFPTPVGAGIYDDDHEKIIYSGSWLYNSNAPGGPYDNSMHYTTVPGSKASLTFTGKYVSLIYTKHFNRGNIRVTIDGGQPVTINAYSSTTIWQSRWDSPELSSGIHIITIEHPGGATYIDVDAIEVRTD